MTDKDKAIGKTKKTLTKRQKKLVGNSKWANELEVILFTNDLCAEDGEDLIQEYLIAQWLTPAKYNYFRDYKIRRKIIQEINRIKKSKRTIKGLLFEVVTQQRKKSLGISLKSCSPDEKHVLILNFRDGYSLTEIAKKLRKPIGTIRSHYQRAITKLRNHYKDNQEFKNYGINKRTDVRVKGAA